MKHPERVILFILSVLMLSTGAAAVAIPDEEALERLGLTPESAALAALSEAQLVECHAAVLGQTVLLEEIGNVQQSLAIVSEAHQLAIQALDEGEPEQAAIETHFELLAELEGLKDQLHQIALELQVVMLAPLPQEKADSLLIWLANSTRRVPPEFRVLSLTEFEWRDVERALRLEARAEAEGFEMPEGYETMLANLRADPAVVAAQLNYQLHYSQMQEHFGTLSTELE